MKPRSPRAFRLPSRGFTLIELLVSLTVLSLLVAMLGVVTNLTSQAISFNTRKLDAAGQARLVFDRLANDLAARVRRSDVAVLFTKATGNDSFQFLSEVDGYEGSRQVASIGYRIQQSTAGRLYQLERGAVGTDWGAPNIGTNPSVPFLPAVMTAALNSDPNYDVLASGVFRLEFCYLLNTGSMSNSGDPELSSVSGIVVALGILDNSGRQLVSNTELPQLAAALPDAAEGQDPLSGWNAAMAEPTFASGLPHLATQGIRVYQRTFYVH